MRKFNLSLDDFSPHPKAGLNFESIKWCNKIIHKYPEFKINLFIPSAYCRLGEVPQYISEYSDWLDSLKKLPKENYRFNFHGHYHSRQWLPALRKGSPSNNDEWQFLDHQGAVETFDMMIKEFDKARIEYHKTFRPPGWKISESAARVLTEKGFIIAGDKGYYEKYKNKISNLKWVSYNWDMTDYCKIKVDVLAYGHTSNWCNNYMDETRYNLIMNLLKRDNFEFSFIEDL